MQSNLAPGSPCNKECIMDPATHFCKGCYRTIEEIIKWQFFTPEEKIKILNLAEKRKLSKDKNQRPS